MEFSLSDPISIFEKNSFYCHFLSPSPISIELYPCQFIKKSIQKNQTWIELSFQHQHQLQEKIEWIESFESKCIDLLIQKKTEWFQNQITDFDIENAFQSMIRFYKKKWILKCYIQSHPFYLDDDTFSYACVLKCKGIKFTSRFFKIDVELKSFDLKIPLPTDNNNNTTILHPIVKLKSQYEIGLTKYINQRKEVIQKKKEYYLSCIHAKHIIEHYHLEIPMELQHEIDDDIMKINNELS
jgi:hypothetical protein